MSIKEEYPGNPAGSANIPTPEPPDKIVISLSPGMPDVAPNPGNGCLFFIFGPFLWVLDRRNQFSQKPPTDFQP